LVKSASNYVNRPGIDVIIIILNIFAPKCRKIRIFTDGSAILWLKIDESIGSSRNSPFFRQKLVKIAKNCLYNISFSRNSPFFSPKNWSKSPKIVILTLTSPKERASKRSFSDRESVERRFGERTAVGGGERGRVAPPPPLGLSWAGGEEGRAATEVNRVSCVVELGASASLKEEEENK
jgi:hypothetical protein